MEFKRKQMDKMFSSIELKKMYKEGQMDHVLRSLGSIINPNNLVASAGDSSVFHYQKNNQKYVVKIVPKNIRFFKHFGKKNSAKDFKKYINRLSPYFLPVEDLLYEDKNLFVYSQKECKVIESKKINKKVVIEVLRLIQFMLVNDILLTDLAPHNIGLLNNHVVVFDYHGLHRLTKNGVIKREDWWRRLVRNITRYITGLISAHKRAEYSLLMQNCNESVVKKLESDDDIPKVFSVMVKYLMTEQNNTKIDKLCSYLEDCINQIKSRK